MNNCINNNEFERRHARVSAGNVLERVVAALCVLLCVFDVPEVRAALRVAAGVAAAVGFYFLIGAVVGGRLNVFAALVSGAAVVLSALFALKE